MEAQSAKLDQGDTVDDGRRDKTASATATIRYFSQVRW